MRRTSQNLHITDGLRADPAFVRKMAQTLLDAMDGMMWALQNMPDGESLRNSIVGCKSELGTVLESIGYILKVRPGFKTVVTKIRRPRQDEPAEEIYPFPAPPQAPAPQPEMSSAATTAARIITSIKRPVKR